MAAIINTNVGSLNAQRNLSMSQTALATAMQRLSSGLRINSAKDDAAGLAISERFSTQIRGLNQAVRNANDGISLSQTAEGALNTISDNLQRIRELSVQSANATNSASDRAALDAEVQQRLAEVDRVAKQTNFNGQRILDGTFGSAAFQVGANVGQTINVNLGTSMKLADVGAIASATSTENVTGIIEGTQGSLTTGAITLANSNFAASGVQTPTTTTAPGTFTPATLANGETFTLSVGGVTIYTETATGADSVTAANLDGDGVGGGTGGLDNATVLSNLATAGITFTGDFTTGDIVFSKADGTDVAVTLTQGAAADGAFANAFVATASNGITAAEAAADDLSFSIGGATVTLTENYTGQTLADMASDIQAQLTTAGFNGGGITVAANTDGTLTFTNVEAGAGTDPTISSIANEGTSGFANIASATVAGAAATPITVAGDFSITVGDADPVSVADGTYTTAQDLVDAINGALGSSGYASLNDDGTLSISSGESITMTAPAALTSLSGTFDVAGDLSTVNVLTVAGANDAMQRVDAALTAVNNLRADFGAIQNRFESTISNLTTTAENLTASRSRIMDADFAQETAALSRAQILQQAGTAMVAQANQLPQGVLALLR